MGFKSPAICSLELRHLRHSAVIVSESAEMGRKAKYLTESGKKKAKREKRTVGLQKSIYLGKEFSAWTDAKRTTEASSDRLDEID